MTGVPGRPFPVGGPAPGVGAQPVDEAGADFGARPGRLGMSVAYFSMEIALEDAVPTYSGGLGVLAGDHLRAAADLGLEIVGVTLLYRQGYLDQKLAADGTQQGAALSFDPRGVLDPLDCVVGLELAGETVEVGAWRYEVRGEDGVVPVYLLDTDRPANSPLASTLTGRLYGGDDEYRLLQEIVLGLGGPAVLEALGHRSIGTFHMNEGHSALLGLALLRRGRAEGGTEKKKATTAELLAGVRRQCAFTTHTPVPAGHDRFPLALVRRYLGDEAVVDLRSLGGIEDGVLHMTRLGMGCSRAVNAVSRRHGEVTRQMFPGVEVGSITNGVHLSTWAAAPMSRLFDERLPGWRRHNTRLRETLTALSLADVAAAHDECKADLLDEVAARTGRRLDRAAFTVGAARRATAYKRMGLLFSDLDRLRAIVQKVGPLQVLMAGKAHPRDAEGKEVVRAVFRAAKELDDAVPVLYLPGYSMDLARLLVSGSDVWLNTPLAPHEASGTSGMKAALNGVPSLSLLDGWWMEGHIEGVTGWAPPLNSGRSAHESAADDDNDAAAVYDLLGGEVMPLYYDDADGFTAVRRSTIAHNAPVFSTERMVEEYRRRVYETDGASS